MRRLVIVGCLIFIFIILPALSSEQIQQYAVISTHNVSDIEKLAQFERGSLGTAIWSPDGNAIFVSGSLGIWKFNAHNLAETPMLYDDYRGPLTLSPDNHTAASLNTEGNIVLWDTQTGQLTEVFYDRSTRLIWITDLAFSPNGSQLAMGFGGGTNMGWTGAVTVWDFSTGKTLIDTQRVIDDPVYIDYSSDGTRLMAGGYGGLAAWDTSTWEMYSLPYGSYVSNLEYSLNTNKLVYFGRNSAILLDLDEEDFPSCMLTDAPDTIRYVGGDIAFSPTDNDILAVSQYEKLALWNVASCEMLTMIPAVLTHIEFSPDGSQLIGVDGNGIHIYSSDDLTEVASVGGFVRSINDMTFSDNSGLLAYSLSSDNVSDTSSVRVWDTATFSEVALITLETNLNELTDPFLQNHVEQRHWQYEDLPDVTFSGVFISPPSIVCSKNYEQRQIIVDLIRGTAHSDTFLQTIWDAHAYPVTRLCLSPDQHTVISADQYSIPSSAPSDALQTIRVWDVKSGKQITILSQLSRNASFGVLRFSQDGQYFSVGGTIWDTANWQIVQEINDERIGETEFSVDSHMFISKNQQGDVVFWDLHTGTPLHTIEGEHISALLLSPDGTLLALKHSNNTIELWGVPIH